MNRPRLKSRFCIKARAMLRPGHDIRFVRFHPSMTAKSKSESSQGLDTSIHQADKCTSIIQSLRAEDCCELVSMFCKCVLSLNRTKASEMHVADIRLRPSPPRPPPFKHSCQAPGACFKEKKVAVCRL